MSDTTPDPKPEVPAAASSADETASSTPAAAAEPTAPEPAAGEAPAAAPGAAPAAEPAWAPEPTWASEPAAASEAAPAPPAYAPAPEAAPPAYTAPPAYQAPAYAAAPAYSAPAGPRTNTLAIVSLVAGIAGFVFLPFIAHLVAVITGHLSLGQIKRTGEGGHGMALTGTILGWVGLALSIIATILIIIVAIGFAASYPNYRAA